MFKRRKKILKEPEKHCVVCGSMLKANKPDLPGNIGIEFDPSHSYVTDVVALACSLMHGLVNTSIDWVWGMAQIKFTTKSGLLACTTLL